MKNNLAILVALTLAVTACASKKAPVQVAAPTPAPGTTAQISQDAPGWFLTPPISDEGIYGTGIAKTPDLNMSLTLAEQRSRVALARTLDENVQAMIVDYQRLAGTLDKQEMLIFSETISRSVANAKLNGVTLKERTQGRDGTVYVLVYQSKADALNTAKPYIESEASRYAEFKATEALKMLDRQIESGSVKTQSQSN